MDLTFLRNPPIPLHPAAAAWLEGHDAELDAAESAR
jgi:hypothetical protein